MPTARPSHQLLAFEQNAGMLRQLDLGGITIRFLDAFIAVTTVVTSRLTRRFFTVSRQYLAIPCNCSHAASAFGGLKNASASSWITCSFWIELCTRLSRALAIFRRCSMHWV
ncbi:hypothetical protein D3C86_1000830 [compost metagenome]